MEKKKRKKNFERLKEIMRALDRIYGNEEKTIAKNEIFYNELAANILEEFKGEKL